MFILVAPLWLRSLVLGQKQNPRIRRRREAPPSYSWVLCPDTLGGSYKNYRFDFAQL